MPIDGEEGFMSVETTPVENQDSVARVQEPPAKKVKSSQSLEDIVLKPKRVLSAGENAVGCVNQLKRLNFFWKSFV